MVMNFNKAEFFASYGQYKQIPAPERPEIAFSGRSNVGKSSLINKIFNRKNLARVSSVPGKTATINFYDTDECFMVDLPGYGYAKTSKNEKLRWAELVEGYLTADRDIALVVQLIDMRHPPSKDDLHMVDFLIDCEQPFIIVFTKSDKLSKREREERRKGFADEIPCFDQITAIEFSAVTGEGVEEVRSVIEEAALTEDQD